MHYPKGPSRCDGGYISTRVPDPGFPGYFEHPGARPWHFGYCNKCNVMTIPVALTRLAPANIRWRFHFWWKYDRFGRRP
jgi:hypothetical protein